MVVRVDVHVAEEQPQVFSSGKTRSSRFSLCENTSSKLQRDRRSLDSNDVGISRSSGNDHYSQPSKYVQNKPSVHNDVKQRELLSPNGNKYVPIMRNENDFHNKTDGRGALDKKRQYLEHKMLDVCISATEKLDKTLQEENREDIAYFSQIIETWHKWLSTRTNRGSTLGSVKNGSILLGFICETTEALDFLWNDWITGQMKSELEEVFSPLFVSQYPNWKITLQVRICSHQYLRYWTKLDARRSESTNITRLFLL